MSSLVPPELLPLAGDSLITDSDLQRSISVGVHALDRIRQIKVPGTDVPSFEAALDYVAESAAARPLALDVARGNFARAGETLCIHAAALSLWYMARASEYAVASSSTARTAGKHPAHSSTNDAEKDRTEDLSIPWAGGLADEPEEPLEIFPAALLLHVLRSATHKDFASPLLGGIMCWKPSEEIFAVVAKYAPETLYDVGKSLCEIVAEMPPLSSRVHAVLVALSASSESAALDVLDALVDRRTLPSTVLELAAQQNVLIDTLVANRGTKWLWMGIPRSDANSSLARAISSALSPRCHPSAAIGIAMSGGATLSAEDAESMVAAETPPPNASFLHVAIMLLCARDVVPSLSVGRAGELVEQLQQRDSSVMSFLAELHDLELSSAAPHLGHMVQKYLGISARFSPKCTDDARTAAARACGGDAVSRAIARFFSLCDGADALSGGPVAARALVHAALDKSNDPPETTAMQRQLGPNALEMVITSEEASLAKRALLLYTALLLQRGCRAKGPNAPLPRIVECYEYKQFFLDQLPVAATLAEARADRLFPSSLYAELEALAFSLCAHHFPARAALEVEPWAISSARVSSQPDNIDPEALFRGRSSDMTTAEFVHSCVHFAALSPQQITKYCRSALQFAFRWISAQDRFVPEPHKITAAFTKLWNSLSYHVLGIAAHTTVAFLFPKECATQEELQNLLRRPFDLLSADVLWSPSLALALFDTVLFALDAVQYDLHAIAKRGKADPNPEDSSVESVALAMPVSVLVTAIQRLFKLPTPSDVLLMSEEEVADHERSAFANDRVFRLIHSILQRHPQVLGPLLFRSIPSSHLELLFIHVPSMHMAATHVKELLSSRIPRVCIMGAHIAALLCEFYPIEPNFAALQDASSAFATNILLLGEMVFTDKTLDIIVITRCFANCAAVFPGIQEFVTKAIDQLLLLSNRMDKGVTEALQHMRKTVVDYEDTFPSTPQDVNQTKSTSI